MTNQGTRRLTSTTIRCSLAFAALLLGGSSASPGTYTIQYAFSGQRDGARPLGLTVDSQGFQYGQTQLGGDNCPQSDGVHGCGVVFRVAPTGAYTVLARFEGPNGANAQSLPNALPGIPQLVPQPSPLIIRQNTLYGVTTFGGAANLGVVFSLQTNGTGFKVLHQFQGTDGAYPAGAIALDQSRAIFGTAAYGGPGYQPGSGATGNGVLYKLQTDGTFQILHDFTGGADNYKPTGTVLDHAGTVYGGTSGTNAGLTRVGSVYRFDPVTATFATLHLFSGDDLLPQVSGLDKHGDIFGYVESSSMPGYLYELAMAASTYNFFILHPFSLTSSDQGAVPNGMSVDADGNLVGVTIYGPASPYPAQRDGKGTIFAYTSGVFSTVFAFDGGPKQGIYPIGAPAVTASGTFLGTTFLDGPHCALANDQDFGCGVVFSYTP